jgi:hypothetical protein
LVIAKRAITDSNYSAHEVLFISLPFSTHRLAVFIQIPEAAHGRAMHVDQALEKWEGGF